MDLFYALLQIVEVRLFQEGNVDRCSELGLFLAPVLADAIRKLVGLLMLDLFVCRHNMEAAFALLFFKQVLEGALVLVDVQVDIFMLHYLEPLLLRAIINVPKHV